ncbi:hypothetical protein NLM33_48930 (plasmid) [Bradyrhizobium sp. CCGUVB1N3]|uniref:hypothetical protein n=1 Tax=Bradyrhizobium sp. CCGUVB1N3 TaxID=2949629 RepID=UPI0020B448F2|nr:hypothetical protein [Bradyrhizobium sp. CCGUVB1N3]MCP3477993.1 hypothetical protein [Bradyrhizobium sp. CCGUVB1N3]
MDPDNFDPFDPFDPGWLQAYDAMLQQQAEPAAPGAVDQVAHEDSEQHLAEERQGGAAPIAGGRPPRSNPDYPHLSDNDQNLISSALGAEVACERLKEGTRCTYGRALRRLGDRLGARGLTIDALDHVSLVALVKAFFPKDGNVVSALMVLRWYREPDTPYGLVVSVDDVRLIDRAIQAAAGDRGWLSKTARRYNRALRDLANSLGPSQTITALDHDSLVDHAGRVSRGAHHLRDLKAGLRALREYRDSNTLADRGPPHHSSTAERGHIIDDAARSNQRTETTPPIGLIRESGNSSLGDGASGAVGSWQMGEQAAHSPLQAVDPGELWQEVDQAGQLPADGWDLANFWEGMPSSLSLSQQSSAPAAALPARPPPWDQATGRSSFAGTSEASSSFVARLSAADFGSIVGLSWEHGSQPAPPELIRALDARGLLPGPCRPTHLRILDRSYSAQWAGRGRREVATLNNLLGGDVMLIPEPGFEHQGPVQVRPGTVPSSAVAASSTAGASSSGQGGSQALYGLPDIGEYVPQDFAHGDTRPIGAQDWGGTSGAESMGPSEMPTGFWGRHFEENIVSDPWQHTSTSGSDRHSAAIGVPPAAHHQAPSQALAGASLPALSVGPLSDTLQAFLARFNAYVGQASGQGLNCLLETVLQLASNTERQDDETPQTQQLQQQAQLLRNSLVQDGTVDPHGEIDLYGAGVGVVLATSFGLRIQAIEAHANGGWTVHPVLGQEGRLVHILHTPGHFQPLWPRH